MMQTRKTTSLKWGVFIFNFIIGVMGVVIVVASLRILFDTDYSHLVFHGSGNYLAGHVLVAAGTSLIIVSLTGCVGVFKGNIWLLGLCFLLLIFFIAVQITFGAIAYSQLGEFHEKVHLGIFWGIQRYYGNDISNTTVIDVIQQSWECCGLNSYASWSNSLYSKRHVPKGIWPTNIFIVPKSCCVDSQSDLCEDMHLNGIRNIDTSISNILHLEGCGPKVMNVIDYYVSCLFGFGVAFVLFEAVAVILCGYLFYRLIKIRNLIQFKTINSPDSSTLLASASGEQPTSSPKQSSTSSPTSYSASRMSLIVPEIPISSIV